MTDKLCRHCQGPMEDPALVDPSLSDPYAQKNPYVCLTCYGKNLPDWLKKVGKGKKANEKK